MSELNITVPLGANSTDYIGRNLLHAGYPQGSMFALVAIAALIYFAAPRLKKLVRK